MLIGSRIADSACAVCAAHVTCPCDLPWAPALPSARRAQWRRLHGAAAEASGTIICPSVGYDYTVADFGTEEARQ